MDKYEIFFSWKKKGRKKRSKKPQHKRISKQDSIYFQVVLRADAFGCGCITTMDVTVKFWKFSLVIENS